STVVIPDGEASATVTITPTADTTVEPNETVEMIVTSGSGYTVGTPASVNGTITNDDQEHGNPAFTSPPPESGTYGTAYRHTFTTSSDPSPSFSLSGTLPPGLSFNATSGTLSGTPT